MNTPPHRTLFIIVFLVIIFLPFVSTAQEPATGSSGENVILVGTLVGEKCVETGKLSPCYVEWAYPMVLFNQQGVYRLELDAVGVNLWELDRAFGKRVALKGRLRGDTITIRNMAPLEPLDSGQIVKA